MTGGRSRARRGRAQTPQQHVVVGEFVGLLVFSAMRAPAIDLSWASLRPVARRSKRAGAAATGVADWMVRAWWFMVKLLDRLKRKLRLAASTPRKLLFVEACACADAVDEVCERAAAKSSGRGQGSVRGWWSFGLTREPADRPGAA